MIVLGERAGKRVELERWGDLANDAWSRNFCHQEDLAHVQPGILYPVFCILLEKTKQAKIPHLQLGWMIGFVISYATKRLI